MGLTHYWIRPTELPADAFRRAVDDCRRLFQDAGAALADSDGIADFVLDDDRIAFNGRAPQHCEPFEVAATEFDRHGRPQVRCFCKTELQPYDLSVKAALIVLHHHLQPAFQVSSDAKPEDWREARELTRSVLGIGDAFELTQT